VFDGVVVCFFSEIDDCLFVSRDETCDCPSMNILSDSCCCFCFWLCLWNMVGLGGKSKLDVGYER
jgi:hypothetical protein